MDPRLDVIFPSQNLKEQYLKIIDNKIERYDEDLNEFSDLEYDPELMEELINFCQNDNFLDTAESLLYKQAARLETTIHLLCRVESTFDFTYSLIDALDFNSLSELKKEYFKLNPYLSLEEFLEGLVWESDNPDKVLRHFTKKIFREDDLDYKKENWDNKVEKWIEEDRDILQLIYRRQLDLLMYPIYPEIRRNYTRNSFKTKTRELSFSVTDNDFSMTSSLYDKFIFCNPNEDVPFVKIFLSSNSQTEDAYKVYTQVSRLAINEWINKDEKTNEESPIEDEDYIFFLVKTGLSSEDASILPVYTECYLGKNKLYIKVPSSLSTETIQTLIQNVAKDLFEINIFEMKERGVKIETFIDNFPDIKLIFLQFYLANNNEASLYIKETNSEVSSKVRKVRLYYKPLSEYEIEEYVIEYEISSANKISIKGPTEELTINFFVNIFGRTIRAFFQRQNAIKIMFHKIILGEDFSFEKKEEKSSKKKKRSTVSDPHLITAKDKINLMKSLNIPLPKGYSTYCQCKRQPIILTDEEKEAWLETGETLFDKNTKNPVQKSVKTFFLENGKKINFACHSIEHPDIYLTKEANDVKDKNELYQLSPCCWNKKRKESVEIDKIVLAKANEFDEISSSKRKEKVYNEENLEEESKEPLYLPQELNQLLSFLSSEENFNLLYPSNKVSNSSFLECILIALKESQINIREYRNIIKDNTNPMVVSQEALGIDRSPESVHEDLSNLDKILDSKLHYRIFEEYFKINIFVFELGTSDIPNSIIEANFEIEIPYHKIFSARTLRRERPTIILLRYKNSSEYSLIVNSKNVAKFNSDLIIVNLMDLFLNSHEASFQSKKSLVRNLFSRINWDKFFGKDYIIAQEIDISGKTRVVQLKSGMTIVIPPTQPFNVPLISKYIETRVEKVKEIFGEPKIWDDKGLWYPAMKIPNLIYVLTGYHELSLPNESLETKPLNLFIPREEKRKDFEILRYRSLKRSVFALIQILHWGWRLDNRPKFDRWISKYARMIREPDNIFDFVPNSIHITFPQTSSVKEGFQEINHWWPEMFTSDGKIILWTLLYDKILIFFDRESLVLENVNNANFIDPPQNHLLGFYDSPEDYPSDADIRIFTSRDTFNLWSRVDRKREENPKISIQNIYSKDSITALVSKETPVRILFKNHWITILNLREGSYENAVKISYNWMRDAKISLDLTSLDYEVIILSFSKKFEIIESEKISKDSKFIPTNKIYVLRYPDNTFASVLLD